MKWCFLSLWGLKEFKSAHESVLKGINDKIYIISMINIFISQFLYFIGCVSRN